MSHHHYGDRDHGSDDDGTPKPLLLTAIRPILGHAFVIIKEDFDVPDIYALDLAMIDETIDSLNDIHAVAAMSMRRLQGLDFAVTPGVRTRADVLIGLAAQLNLDFTELSRVLAQRGHTEDADILEQIQENINYAVAMATRGGGDDDDGPYGRVFV